MKKNFLTFALLMAAFSSCSQEDLLVQNADVQPMPAPVLSRSITETSATIVGYAADGTLKFKHSLRQTDPDANVWEWDPATNVPTRADLENVQDVVCLVPAQFIYGKTLTVTPGADDLLMWDKVSVDELHTDMKFYFDNMRHRLAKICVEVDHLQNRDYLYANYRSGGTFNCLTGEFTQLDRSTYTRIYPEMNSDGLYAATFSVVPQTFEGGVRLLRYRDEVTGGYRNYYHEMPDTTIALQANHMLHIHTRWNTDWSKGTLNKYSVTGVELNKSVLNMKPDQTAILTAVVMPSNAYNKNVTWSSSHPSVAAVAANGKITSRDSGTAIITVTTEDGGYTATCVVTVYQEITGVSIDKTEIDIDEGKTLQLTATITPGNASVKTLKWESSNVKVATVDGNGLVTGLKAGETDITVTALDGGKYATCKVHVKGKAPGSTDSGSMEGDGNSNQSGNMGGLW